MALIPSMAPLSLNEDGSEIIVEVLRGGLVESRHRVAAVLVSADGGVLRRWGKADALIFPRSAIKPLQALPLVTMGAVERCRLDNRRLALACASHNGEDIHVDAVDEWLRDLGYDTNALECGSHDPFDLAATKSLAADHQCSQPLHNNCSGKHAGFLTLAHMLGTPSKGYIEYNHPVQVLVRAVLSRIMQLNLDDMPWGVDGCGIPSYAIALESLAFSFARLAKPMSLEHDLAIAAKKITNAMVAEPYMVAGRNRFDTAAMAVMKGAMIIKSGAEGVVAAALLPKACGLALKCLDGTVRAADAAMAALLLELFDTVLEQADILRRFSEAEIKNAVGLTVGRLRVYL